MSGIRVQSLVIFVLGFGLLACTPDKPTKREDQWRFTPPEIVMPSSTDGAERGRLKIGEASQGELPPSAELTFPNISSDVVLEIDSLCMVGNSPYEESFRLLAPKQVEIGALVPTRALLEASEKVIECTFDFSAVNANRSRHHFLIPGVKVSGIAEYGKLIVSEKLQRISPAIAGEARVVIEVDDLDQLAVDSDVRSGVAELACADFTSRETFRSVDTINWKQLAYKQPIEVLENVLRKFRQPCRLTLQNETGVRVEISAPFIVRYPAPDLEISTSTPAFTRGNDGGPREIAILNLKIKNTSNIDQHLALPNMTAELRVVWTAHQMGRANGDQGFYFWPMRHPTAEIFSSISGAENMLSGNGKTTFLLKAKTEASVTLIARSYYNSYLGGYVHAGYLFLLPQALRLERLEINGEKAGEIPIFSTLPHHFIETQVYVPHVELKADWSLVARIMRSGQMPSRGD